MKRGSSVYNGIFNLLVLRGAQDWMTGHAPQYDDLDDHHIVPKDWGKSQTGLGNRIDTILNRTPLSSDTNRNVIKNRLPNKYLPELISKYGEITVRNMLSSHFISPAALKILLRDPFTVDDFDAFLLERQRVLREGIEELLVKERLDLSPSLRQLDERIERVELSLRSLIDESLGGDESRLPPHVIKKARERHATSVKKNPAVAERLDTLSGKLEYCDLRELEDIVLSKTAWGDFAPRFSSKETLAAKFGQLAELRNGLRHSRTVDEVTRMEGEAAVLWFEQLLPAGSAAGN